MHPFGEGNTRTTAVFAIKYLHSLGYRASNNMFRENSWYFRNALVRANYADYGQGVRRDWGYLERFFRNLLLNETHQLKSRYLLIGLLGANPHLSREGLSAALGICPSAVQKHLAKLKKDNRIRRIGPDKCGHWEVVAS